MWIERLNETISKEILLYKTKERRNRRRLRKRWKRLDCLYHEDKRNKKNITLATNININCRISEHYTSIITPVYPHSWNPFSALLHFHLFRNTNVQYVRMFEGWREGRIQKGELSYFHCCWNLLSQREYHLSVSTTCQNDNLQNIAVLFFYFCNLVKSRDWRGYVKGEGTILHISDCINTMDTGPSSDQCFVSNTFLYFIFHAILQRWLFIVVTVTG